MDTSFLQNSHFYYSLINPETGLIEDVNRSLANQLGRFRKELINQPVKTICPECSVPDISKHLSERPVYYLQSDIVAEKDQILTVSWEIHSQDDLLVMIGRDVTDLRKNVFYRNRQSKRLEILKTVISEQQGSLTSRINRLLELALEYLSLDVGIVSEIIGDDYFIRYFRPHDVPADLNDSFDYKDTYCDILINEGRSWATNHMGKSKYAKHACYEIFKVESYIGSQIFVDNTFFGTLNFSSPKVSDKYFLKEEVAFVEMLGSLIGIMIEDDLKTKESEKSFDILKGMIKNTPAPIAMFDKKVRYLACSDAWREEYQIQEKQIIGKSHYEVFSNISQHWKDIHQQCLNGETLENPEDSFINSNGAREWLKWVVKPWYDRNDDIGGIIMLTEVITKQKTIELSLKEEKERAEEANKAKTRFLSNMSHELRTPLNAIIGYSQLIADSLESGNINKKNSQIIQSSGQHLLSMINDILSLAKIEAGQMKITKEMFNFIDLIRDLKLMFQPKADEKHLTLELNIQDGLPESIECDEGKIRQILINLIGNALKFTTDGFVKIECSAVEQVDHMNFILRISDSGPGIEEGDTKLIFESFGQSNTYQQEGTGLGLTITKNLTNLLNGTIILRSTPGVGSEFEVTIPVKKYHHYQHVPVESQTTIKLPKTYHALIADDIKINSLVLDALLKKIGFDTSIADDGQHAIDQAKEIVFDIIFMDIRMPQKDGIEAHNEIRQLDGYTDVPVIAVTASGFDEKKSELLSIGFSDVMIKPFSQNQLFEIIDKNLAVELKQKQPETVKIFSVEDFVSVLHSLNSEQKKEVKTIIRNQDFIDLVTFTQSLYYTISEDTFQHMHRFAERLEKEFDFESLIKIGKKIEDM